MAGIVVETGIRVTRFKPGDAVFASVFDLGTGMLADFPACLRAPLHSSRPISTSCRRPIPMVGLTSWQALKQRAQLKPGQTIIAAMEPNDGSSGADNS